MQAVLRLGQIEKDTAADAFHTECNPFQKQIAHAQNTRHARNQHIKVAGKGIFQRRGFKQLAHQLFGVCAAFQIYGDFQALFIGFITDVGNFTRRAAFHLFNDFINNRLGGCGRGDFRNINTVV